MMREKLCEHTDEFKQTDVNILHTRTSGLFVPVICHEFYKEADTI